MTRNASPTSFLASALRVFEFTLGEMLWSRRTIFMFLVVGGPVVIALVLRMLVSLDLLQLERRRRRAAAVAGWSRHLRADGLGLLSQVHGAGPRRLLWNPLIADEVEDKTITYLFTRPVLERSGPGGEVSRVSGLCTMLGRAARRWSSSISSFVPHAGRAASARISRRWPTDLGLLGPRTGRLRRGVRAGGGLVPASVADRSGLRVRVGAGGGLRARGT